MTEENAAAAPEPAPPVPAPAPERRPGLLAALLFLAFPVAVALGPDQVLALAGAPRSLVRAVQREVVYSGKVVREKPVLGAPDLRIVSYAFMGQEAVTEVGQLAIVLAGVLYLRRRSSGAIFALDRPGLLETARIGAILGGGIAVASVAGALVAARVASGLYLRIFIDRLDMALLAHPAGLFLALVSMVFLAPLAEEVVFRGILYRALRGRVSVGPAAIVQAGIFAACHLGTGLDAPLIALPYVWGLVAALTVERTRSLGGAVLLHAAGNAVGLVVIALVMGSPAEVYALLGGR